MTPNDIPGNTVPRELGFLLWREPVLAFAASRPISDLPKAA